MGTKSKLRGRTVAGAFSIRNVAAELIGFYGAVLVVVGIVDDADLWTGILLLLVAAGLALWPRLRPLLPGRRGRRP